MHPVEGLRIWLPLLAAVSPRAWHSPSASQTKQKALFCFSLLCSPNQKQRRGGCANETCGTPAVPTALAPTPLSVPPPPLTPAPSPCLAWLPLLAGEAKPHLTLPSPDLPIFGEKRQEIEGGELTLNFTLGPYQRVPPSYHHHNGLNPKRELQRDFILNIQS